jgi:hypothetical protein
MNDWVERGKDVVSRGKDQIGAAMDAARQTYRDTAKGDKNS